MQLFIIFEPILIVQQKMVLPLAVMVLRVAVLRYSWAPRVEMAIQALIARGLSRYDLNQLRETLVAQGDQAIVKLLGEINEVLSLLK